MEREYQPTLLWGYVLDFAKKEWPDLEIEQKDVQCYIYRTDSAGAYFLNKPKLYWQEEPITGSYFSACDQDELFKNKDKLGEMIIYYRNPRDSKFILLGKTFAESWKRLTA